MNITVNRKALISKLKPISVLKTNNMVENSLGVWFRIDNPEELEIGTYNGFIGVFNLKLQCQCNVEAVDSSFVLDANHLLSVLMKIAGDEVKLEPQKSSVKVYDIKTKANISCLDDEQFRSNRLSAITKCNPLSGPVNTCHFRSKDMFCLLNRLYKTALKGHNQHTYSNVGFGFDKEKNTLVGFATDNRRVMFENVKSLFTKIAKSGVYSLHRGSIPVAISLIGIDDDLEYDVNFQNNCIQIKNDNTEIVLYTSKANIDKNLFDMASKGYKKINTIFSKDNLDKTYAKEKISRRVLIDILRDTYMPQRDKTHLPSVTLTTKNRNMTIKFDEPFLSMENNLPVRTEFEVEVKFNPTYLLDVLTSFENEEVDLHISDQFIFVEEDKHEVNTKYFLCSQGEKDEG